MPVALTLGAEHGGALGDAAECLPKVAAPADEGHGELVLVDVVLLVGHGQHLALVNVVHLQRLEDLSLDEVADAGLQRQGTARQGLGMSVLTRRKAGPDS